MKNSLLVAVVAVLCFCALVQTQAQTSFTFVPYQTSITDTLGSEMVLYATVRNVSSGQISLRFIRSTVGMPAGWQTSMCLNVCYPPSIDTIETTATYGSAPLNPGDTLSFSVHFYTATNQGTGRLHIRILNMHNPADSTGIQLTAQTRTTSVSVVDLAPARFSLEQNYPNPFNPATTIAFSVPSTAFTTLKVYNLLGQEMATLVQEVLQAGSYKAVADAQHLPTGVYVYRLQSGNLTTSRKLIVLK